MPLHHVPVMLREAVLYLNCSPGKVVVDCTLGGSGHAGAILEKIQPDRVADRYRSGHRCRT